MPDRQDPAALLVEHLPWIDRAATSLCRRNGFGETEAEDFASWVKEKLIEDDYAVLRKFRGESALTTYLTVVVSMLLRDYRVRRWGRWRPSAAARRHGRVAVRLETLVRRDGYGLAQAAEILRTSGTTDLSDGDLARLLAELPDRQPLRPVEVGPEPLAAAHGGGGADEAVLAEEGAAERDAASRALSRAMETLPDEDRVIVRLRYAEEMSVADIARTLGLPQKPLYRRTERDLAHLRREMESAGISRERVRAMLGGGAG